MRPRRSKPPRPDSPERSCVGCRGRFPREDLLRTILDSSGCVRLDYLGKQPGRGAYVCPNANCIVTAAERGGFARAFRQQVVIVPEQLMHDAWLASRQQLRSLISLAHRAGKAPAGNSRVEHCLREEQGQLLLLACDSSEGVKRKFRQWAQRNQIQVQTSLPKMELGPPTGNIECSLVMITDAGFARRIEQEVRRSVRLVPNV